LSKDALTSIKGFPFLATLNTALPDQVQLTQQFAYHPVVSVIESLF
jgi:hypothetical protein